MMVTEKPNRTRPVEMFTDKGKRFITKAPDKSAFGLPELAESEITLTLRGENGMVQYRLRFEKGSSIAQGVKIKDTRCRV